MTNGSAGRAAAEEVAHGLLVEKEARRTAALLGLPDFVYQAELVARGGGNREPGDALLFANGIGAIVQVKSRDPELALTDSPEKVQKWIERNGKKAHRQASGTRRQLISAQSAGHPVLAIPVRASHLSKTEQRRAALTIDMDVSSWPSVIVLDHPSARGCLSPMPPDAFWITLDDWTELHRAIRSTTGVLSYISRVLATDPTPHWTLGTERDRYAAFAAADMEAAAGDGSSAGYFDWSVIDDPVAVERFRDVLTRVWPEDGRLPEVPIEEYRMILEHLDATPPGMAAQLGRWIFRKREHLREHRSWSSGMFRDAANLTIYACDHADNYGDVEEFTAQLAALMATRGAELLDHGVLVGQTAAVGVLQGGGWLDYRFAFASPPLDVTGSVRFAIQQAHGYYDNESGTIRSYPAVPRNAICPCGSELKYKRCHGAL